MITLEEEKTYLKRGIEVNLAPVDLERDLLFGATIQSNIYGQQHICLYKLTKDPSYRR